MEQNPQLKLAPGKSWYLSVRLIRCVLVFKKLLISRIFLDPSIKIQSIKMSYCNYTLTKQIFLSSLMHFELILIWTYLPVAMQYASHLPLGQWINKHFMGRIIPLWLSIYENNISNINPKLSQHQDQLTVNYHFLLSQLFRFCWWKGTNETFTSQDQLNNNPRTFFYSSHINLARCSCSIILFSCLKQFHSYFSHSKLIWNCSPLKPWRPVDHHSGGMMWFLPYRSS